MTNEVLHIEKETKRCLRRERVYFVLLFLSTILTGCGLAVMSIALGKIGINFLVFVLILFILFWTRRWIRVMTIRDAGVSLGLNQHSIAYEKIHQYAEKVGLWKMPEVIITQHPDVKRPHTIGLFQKYMIVLPSHQEFDEAARFELIRELVRLKQNYEEKNFLVLLGSWVPFLRAAYIKACEETTDRLAFAQLKEEERIPALVRSIVGPTLWDHLNLVQYIEEKCQPSSFSLAVSGLFRQQQSVSRRLATAGLKTVSSRRTRLVTSLFVSLSYVVLIASFVFITTVFEISDQLPNWAEHSGQSVNSKEDLGETKLMAAIQKGTLDEINKLIPTSDMKAVDADGDTALHYLGYRKSSEGLEDVFKDLLAAGADEDSVNEFGERPFITAVYSNNKELVELYLKRGEAVNQQDDEKYTPLHHAVEGEGTQTVKLLLEKGADPALNNADGYTPLMMAEEYELDEIIHLLKQHQTQTL